MDQLGTIILVIVGLLELGFTIYIFKSYQRNSTITYFGLFSLCVAGWVLVNSIGILPPTTATLDFIGRLSFVFAAFLFSFLYLFVLNFPFPAEKSSRRFVLFVLTPPAILSVLALFSKSLVRGFIQKPYGPTIYGSEFWVYFTVLLFFYTLIIFEIASRIKKHDEIRRWQLKVLLAAALISGILGITQTLILPYVFEVNLLYWLGPAASFIWLAMMWWIIRK